MIEHGVERHLPYVVCMEDGGMQCVIEHGVERHLPYAVCMEDGGVTIFEYKNDKQHAVEP